MYLYMASAKCLYVNSSVIGVTTVGFSLLVARESFLDILSETSRDQNVDRRQRGVVCITARSEFRRVKVTYTEPNHRQPRVQRTSEKTRRPRRNRPTIIDLIDHCLESADAVTVSTDWCRF